MFDAKRFVCLSVAVLFVFSTGAVFAQDWPQWRGVNRDGKAAFDAPKEWPKELKQGWRTEVGFGDATPALVGDKLYLHVRQGDEEVILCLNASDGSEIWRNHYAAPSATGPAQSHPGPRSSPTVTDGKVVTLGVSGIVSCLDASSGNLLWRKDDFPNVVPRFFTAMSPIVVDGMAVAHVGGAGNGAMIAYNLAGGGEKWRWADEGPEYCSPVLMNAGGVKQIVTLTEKSAVGVSVADGKLLWKLPFVPQQRTNNSPTPIIDGDTVIITGAGRGTKAFKVEKKDGEIVTTELWSDPNIFPQFNSPVLKDGLLIGISSRDALFCLDAKDGKTAWTNDKLGGKQGFGSLVDTGNVMLALTNQSELVAFKLDAANYEELGRNKVADTEIYAHPVASGKRIFIKDQKTLTLWTLN